MATVSDVINYYVGLLIIQYHNEPKAMATIQLFAQELYANGILLDIQNAYNVDTAVGKQLDIIGKYEGVDRYYSLLNLEDYFSFQEYNETATSPPRYGFSDYTTYDGDNHNGTLIYSEIIAQANALFDEDFRTLIKLKIIENNSNYSHQQIDNAIFDLFGTDVRPESTGNMAMQYFISANVLPLLQAILYKRLLPKPMGVLLSAIDGITGDMFSFTDYSGYESPYGFGFSTYANYDTLPGQVLSYNQITEV